MSRPKNLPTALQSWANANYSAGPPWGGTPQRSAPAGSALVPGVSLPAENENYLHGNAFDAAQAAINCVGQIPALNWNAKVAAGVSIVSLGWSEVEQAWYGFATSGTSAVRSADNGKTWATVTVQNIGGFDVAFDTSGNAVSASAAGGVQEAAFVAYGTALSWTLHAGAIASGGAWAIVYEPVNALWAIMCGTAAAPAVYTAPQSSRATWTSRALPGTWVSGTGNQSMGAGGGILVATYVLSSTQVRTMRSANGGVTWTNDQSITVNGGITIPASVSTTRPCWSATDGLWYFAIGQASTRKTQIFSSPDGITWTSAAVLLTNDVHLIGMQCVGSLLVGINDDGRVLCSFNQGVNWWRCGLVVTPALAAQTSAFKATPNGFAITDGAGGVQTSYRFGMPATAA